ncbi:MAG: Ig-like domain-containing protein, partial [Elusimicrobiota bacterium]
MKKLKISAILFIFICFVTAGIYGGFGLGLPSIVEEKAKDMDEEIKEIEEKEKEEISDDTNPQVSITSPADEATVNGIETVEADASDNTGVDKVEFFVDSISKYTDTSSSFNYSWDTRTVDKGTHTVTAKAYDAAGNTDSDQHKVTVDWKIDTVGDSNA